MDCIVMDVGSTVTKVGFSGEDSAISQFPTVVGKPGNDGLSPFGALSGMRVRKGGKKGSVASIAGQGEGATFVGREALAHADSLELTQPIRRGKVEDWEGLQKVWDYSFNHELQVEAENYTVLLTDSPVSLRSDREKMAEIMFETFNVRGCSIAPEPVLALFCTGRTRGLVVGSGGQVSSVVPIFEGFSLRHAIKHMELAGEDLTELLQNKVRSNLPKDIVNDMKERICSVAPTKFKPQDLKSAKLRRQDPKGTESLRDSRQEDVNKVSYELPDGQIVELEMETQFGIPEALFDPSIAGREVKAGISHLTFQSLLACDKTLQKDLLNSIVLSGGSTSFPGFAARLESEILEMASATQVQTVADSKRKNAAWIGGSMFASLETFSQIHVSRGEWEEQGAKVVHQKCL